MTRRQWIAVAAALPAAGLRAAGRDVTLPLCQVVDTRARFRHGQLSHFWLEIWSEAVRDFGKCGVRFQAVKKEAEVKRSPSDLPVFTGLERGMLNLVVTEAVPLRWDRGKGLAGVTVLWQGYHLCGVALEHAHGHQIPFLSVNTCVHELLHAVTGDIFEKKPEGVSGAGREALIDAAATRLWLFGGCGEIAAQAARYADRLREKHL